MSWKKQQKLVAWLVEPLRKPEHEPIVEDIALMPCYDKADLLARIIAAVDESSDDRGLGMFDFRFGGAGDNGEFLIGILDVLFEAGIIQFSPQIEAIAATGKES